MKHGLILSSVLLLEARKLVEEAFELLDCELRKTWMENAMLSCKLSILTFKTENIAGKFSICFSAKYINEAIRLANVHREEARQGNWLFKILNRILSLPEAELHEESSKVSCIAYNFLINFS